MESSEIVIERPDERVLAVWRTSAIVSYAIVTLVVSAVVGALVYFADASAWLLFAPVVPIAIGLAALVVLRKQWEAWTFSVTPEALEMSHGLLYRQRRVVARDRIQHIDINSGPFDRKFGLVQVVIHTAGSSVGFIPGLRPERAERMRQELMAGRGA